MAQNNLPVIPREFQFCAVLLPIPVKYFLSCHSSQQSYFILSVSIHLPFRLDPSRTTFPPRCIFVSVRLIVAVETASASPNALYVSSGFLRINSDNRISRSFLKSLGSFLRSLGSLSRSSGSLLRSSRSLLRPSRSRFEFLTSITSF